MILADARGAVAGIRSVTVRELTSEPGGLTTTFAQPSSVSEHTDEFNGGTSDEIRIGAKSFLRGNLIFWEFLLPFYVSKSEVSVIAKQVASKWLIMPAPDVTLTPLFSAADAVRCLLPSGGVQIQSMSRLGGQGGIALKVRTSNKAADLTIDVADATAPYPLRVTVTSGQYDSCTTWHHTYRQGDRIIFSGVNQSAAITVPEDAVPASPPVPVDFFRAP